LPLIKNVIEEAISALLLSVEQNTGVNVLDKVIAPVATLLQSLSQKALLFYKEYPDASSVLLTVLVIYVLSSVSFA